MKLTRNMKRKIVKGHVKHYPSDPAKGITTAVTEIVIDGKPGAVPCEIPPFSLRGTFMKIFK